MINLDSLSALAEALKKTKDLGEKQELLLNFPLVSHHLEEIRQTPFFPHGDDLSSKIAFYAIIAIGQYPVLFYYPQTSPPKEKIRSLLALLVAIDRFYESIGGIVGYQVQVLQFLQVRSEKPRETQTIFSRPPGVDLNAPFEEVLQTILTGIRAIDEIGEIYPIGGLGSRLNLMSKTQAPLPAACLQFGGRTLLEGLIRDVQAREFLYYRLFGKQVTVPVAMMTSLEKQNATRIKGICEKQKWFGRPKESFCLFSQLSVPVVTHEGRWSMKAPLEMNLQPGGHGALWKAAEEKGVFFWFQNQEKSHVLIRQINNPIAGLDFGLLALVGVGKNEQKAFGFASCDRLPQTAEGVLVLVEEENTKRLSNIEYTDFKQFGIEDRPALKGFSPFPANTNILYANLPRMLPIIRKNPLPGLILNMKNKEPYLCPAGKLQEAIGGRLESMMQNISDALFAEKNDPLPTFLTYNSRQKTISVAKKSFEAGQKLLETPEGAFYDLLANAHSLLSQECNGNLPPFCSPEQYLEKGPNFLFLYHPALGPLYRLIAQKIQRPVMREKSELQLEIADAKLVDLDLEGSLLIEAKHILGHLSQNIIRYSHKTGKCLLNNVKVKNKGMQPAPLSHYWRNQIKRHQTLHIVLEGHSEFYAENVVFSGNHTIVVPHGERWIASQGADGKICYHVEKAGWRWEYCEKDLSLRIT